MGAQEPAELYSKVSQIQPPKRWRGRAVCRGAGECFSALRAQQPPCSPLSPKRIRQQRLDVLKLQVESLLETRLMQRWEANHDEDVEFKLAQQDTVGLYQKMTAEVYPKF
ncbi:hypothetical protein NDU88_003216 [Pleurodeles waltl]|uniref:Uncharacterized protein n=1 Tax=Pleurodeles waltl TaxID=8319 RepID=A0AAV7KU95_PLEWA|nr:hypothetical protein NDU88_003216 [Pleurodeles waltl]